MFLNLPDKLVGSKVTALYENGWFTGTIEYYNAKLKEYKVNYLDNTSDFVSPDDFDGVEVILEQLWIGTTDTRFLKKDLMALKLFWNIIRRTAYAIRKPLLLLHKTSPLVFGSIYIFVHLFFCLSFNVQWEK